MLTKCISFCSKSFVLHNHPDVDIVLKRRSSKQQELDDGSFQRIHACFHCKILLFTDHYLA